jgi:uncharacterized protein (DUF2267 family)
MPAFDLDRFRERVIDLSPSLDEDGVDRITRVTLRSLADQLTHNETDWLKDELPGPLASALDRGRPVDVLTSRTPVPPSREALFTSVATAEAIDMGLAIEHTEIVCRALAELLPHELIQVLRKHLPPLSELFEIPPPMGVGSGPSPGAEIDSYLSGGRPGSRHPIASANPQSLAHEHSIARSDDPHGDRRLSSSHLPTEEREDRTLATGEAGARRRLSDSS